MVLRICCSLFSDAYVQVPPTTHYNVLKNLISALGCDIVLDRDQDHNDLDKCLLTIKDRNKDVAVVEAIGELDVKVCF